MEWISQVIGLVSIHLLEIVSAIVVVTLGHLISIRLTVPTMMPLPPASGPPMFPQRSQWETELQALNFKRLGEFEGSSSKMSKVFVHAYISPDRLTVVALSEIVTVKQPQLLIALTTRLIPSGGIVTTNNRQANAMYSPPDKILVKTPWKKQVAEFLELHRLVVDTARTCGYCPEAVVASNYREVALATWRRDCDNQVQTGRLTPVDANTYRFTLKGIVLTAPVLWWSLVEKLFFGWYQPGDRAIRDQVRRRFQRLRERR